MRSLHHALLLAALSACTGAENDSPPPARASGDTTTIAAPARPADERLDIRVDTIATGLEVPWAMDFAPDGRIFVTERPGRIRVVENGRLRAEPWATLPVYAEDESLRPESGLMGIALAPDFATSGHLYVVGTFWKSDAARAGSLPSRIARRAAGLFSAAAGSPWENRVYRLTDRGGRGVEATVIVDDLPASYYHAGGGLAFGPDGMLYVTTGDALHPKDAADRESLAGKVLRYRSNGGIPADNPYPGSPVYAMGLRNTQALAWHPRTRELFGADHGPSGMTQEDGRADRDELNVLMPGGNYGWPRVAGLDDGADAFERPIAVWTPAITPSGMAFYTGPEPAWAGDLFLGGLRGQRLTRLTLVRNGAAGWSVVARDTLLLAGVAGRIRALRMGPDDLLYLTTSNRDGRGAPRAGDDLLLRLAPARPVAASR